MDELFHAGLSNAAAAAVLAVIVAVVTRFWRNPFVAHTLWLLVLLKLVTPPLWTVPLAGGVFDDSARAIERPPDRQTAAVRADPASRAGPERPKTVQEEIANSPVPFVSSQVSLRTDSPELRGDPPRLNNSDPVSFRPEFAESRARDRRKGPATAAPAFAVQTSPDVPLRPIRELVIAAWLLGSGLLFAALLLRTVWFGRNVLGISRRDEAIQRLARELAARIGLRRCPTVRVLHGAIGPAVWCPARRPVLLVPECIAAAAREQLQTVLTHELVHLHRHDHRVRQLEALVLLLYWWHPAVWWAVARLRQVEEECCDSEVLARNPDSAPRYAEVLLSTMELLHNSRPAEAAFSSGFGRRNQMKRRIEMILTQPADRRLKCGSRSVLVLAALALPLVPGFAESEPLPGEKPSQAEYSEPEGESAEEATTDGSEPPVVQIGHRRDRPYGELGFLGDQYGPHWEFVRLAGHGPVQCEINASPEQQRELNSICAALMRMGAPPQNFRFPSASELPLQKSVGQGQWKSWDHGFVLQKPVGQRHWESGLRHQYLRAREVLTDEQEQRIQQIVLQRRGVTAFLDEDVRQKLGLIDKQVERIRSAWEDHVARARKGWKGDEGRQSLYGVWKTALAILNDDQRAKFAEMVGPPVREHSCEPLTLDQLLALNRRAGELQQFRDNAFLFEEKATEFIRDAEQEYAGRSICLTGKVERVTREHVVMQIVNVDAKSSDRFPSIILLNAEANESLKVPEMTQRMFDLNPQIGRTLTWSAKDVAGKIIDLRPALTLDVETLVPLQQAKRLRAGDDIQVCATLRDVVLVTGGGTQLGFVFTNPELSQPSKPLEELLSHPVPQEAERRAATPPAGTEVKIFTLQNASADSLAKLLRELFEGSAGKPVRITSDSRTNSLIVAASEQDLEIIEAIIIRLDESPAERDSDETGEPPSGAAAPSAQDGASAAKSSEYVELLRTLMPLKGVELRFLDESNGIVATGSREDVERVSEVMRLLERLTTAQVKVFPLKNLDAAELAKALNAPPFELPKKGLYVQADRETNRLIVAGSAESLDLLEALLEQLDRSRDK